MKSNKQKDVTINELAVMVANGFSAIDKRFDGIDKRLESIEKRLDELEKRVDNIEEDLKKIRHDILNIGDKFVSQYEFSRLLSRVSQLEEKIKIKK